MKKLLSLVIVILTVLMSIELIAIADNAIGFLPDGTRTVTFLTYISREEYAYCVERYYKNEALGVEPDEEMLECYGVARYYEAALQRQVRPQKRRQGAGKGRRRTDGTGLRTDGRACAGERQN